MYEKLSLDASHLRICRLEDSLLLDCTATLGALWYRSQELDDFIDVYIDVYTDA